MLKPGATIGILGGGQLGRMMAISAAKLGFRCIAYTPEGDIVADQVASDVFARPWDDAAALAAFAARCEAVTWEFENVPLAAVEAIPADRLFPPRRALEVAQDRLNEKRFVEELGGRCAAYCPVDSRDDLDGAVARIGTPGILKTRRDGYDGKGQWRIASEREAAAVGALPGPAIYEGLVRFAAEFSVILVRDREGAVRFWDSPRNEHQGGILDRSLLPAGAQVASQVEEARALTSKVADSLGYVGVLTCEFFATADGPVFNEMAPRVHNSGHWTIEGAVTSQFENHIRAVAGLPLGDTRTVASTVEMVNLIGTDALDAGQLLVEPDTHLHLYGKKQPREGRKMGHLTRLTR